MLTVNTSRICILALQHLWLAWNWNTKVADVLDILQRNTVLYQYLRLIKWLLIHIEIEVIASLDSLEVNLLEILQTSTHMSTIAHSIPVCILGILIINHLRVYLQNDRVRNSILIHCHIHHWMVHGKADTNIMFQIITLIQRPGWRTRSSTSWFRNIDATFLTILPRIESSSLDNILQVITVCEVIELGDMILFEDILKILPVTSSVHCFCPPIIYVC